MPTIQIKRGPAASWSSANPVLLLGEWGMESDTGKTKLGDGTSAWNALAYRDAETMGFQVVSEKDAANGYVGLDSSAKVPQSKLPNATT